MNAHLMKSFGGLAFGATETAAEKIFGKPEETEKLTAIDGSVSRVWHYWSKGFTLFFDQADGGRFCCVEADNHVPLTIWEKNIFSLNEIQLKKLFGEHGYTDVDEEHHEWGEKRISFDSAMVDFYFENGSLVSVNFGVVISESTVILPN